MGRKVDRSKFLEGLSRSQLTAMVKAGEDIRECYRALARAGSNTVSELLRGQGEFLQWDHYPKGEVIDRASHSQYYYHAHPKTERPGEHGHFHTFIRYEGMPKRPTPPAPAEPAAKDERIGAHLVGISMNNKGFPIKLFTTNRWVTDETWYDGATVISALGRFEIGHTHPSWATNRWITALIVLFRPQIADLIRKRDRKIASWGKRYPGRDVLEDRRLEVLAEIAISVDQQIEAVVRALAK